MLTFYLNRAVLQNYAEWSANKIDNFVVQSEAIPKQTVTRLHASSWASHQLSLPLVAIS